MAWESHTRNFFGRQLKKTCGKNDKMISVYLSYVNSVSEQYAMKTRPTTRALEDTRNREVTGSLRMAGRTSSGAFVFGRWKGVMQMIGNMRQRSQGGDLNGS